jgi:hypothetical protein
MILRVTKGFIVHGNVWWLQCIMVVTENLIKVTINILHLHSLHQLNAYPQQPGIISIPLLEVLLEVGARKATGRTHTLTSAKTQLRTEMLRHKGKY